MAKRKVVWSPKAKRNLFSILDYYYKRNGSKIYSNKLNASLQAAIKLLENFPQLGIKSDIDGVRVVIHTDYAIFYEASAETIYIISIWDSRQNPEILNISNK